MISPFYGGIICGIIIGAVLVIWALWCFIKTAERRGGYQPEYISLDLSKPPSGGSSVQVPKPKLPPAPKKNTLT